MSLFTLLSLVKEASCWLSEEELLLVEEELFLSLVDGGSCWLRSLLEEDSFWLLSLAEEELLLFLVEGDSCWLASLLSFVKEDSCWLLSLAEERLLLLLVPTSATKANNGLLQTQQNSTQL